MCGHPKVLLLVMDATIMCALVMIIPRKVWVYFMKHKSEVFSRFKSFKDMVEKEKGMHIKLLRSDRVGDSFVI